MLLRLSIICILSAGILPAAAKPLAISQKSLAGTWACGPTSMKGPHFVITVSYVTTRAADLSFVSAGTTVIKPDGKPAFTFTDSSRGTWRLDGRTLISEYKEPSTFISTSNQAISNKMGQKVLDDEHRKKSVFKARILSIDAKSLRSVPVDSAYAEAVVESTCTRA